MTLRSSGEGAISWLVFYEGQIWNGRVRLKWRFPTLQPFSLLVQFSLLSVGIGLFRGFESQESLGSHSVGGIDEEALFNFHPRDIRDMFLEEVKKAGC